MSIRVCPACDKGRLIFSARPMPSHDDVVEVIATCDFCWYIFLYHFSFEEMLTEVVINIEIPEADHIASTRPNHLRLVKS